MVRTLAAAAADVAAAEKDIQNQSLYPSCKYSVSILQIYCKFDRSEKEIPKIVSKVFSCGSNFQKLQKIIQI